MSSLIEHVERAEIARWEAVLNEDVRCEIEDHWETGEDTRYHAGPGAFAAKSPCNLRRVVCRPFRDATWFLGSVKCDNCGGVHAFLDMTWIEL